MNKRAFAIKTKDGNFKVAIWLDKKDGVYLVKGITLPDVITFGRSLTDAKKMAREAIELYCACAIDDKKIVIDELRKVIGVLPKSHVINIA